MVKYPMDVEDLEEKDEVVLEPETGNEVRGTVERVWASGNHYYVDLERVAASYSTPPTSFRTNTFTQAYVLESPDGGLSENLEKGRENAENLANEVNNRLALNGKSGMAAALDD